MLSHAQTMNDSKMMTGFSQVRTHDPFHNTSCRTRALVDDFYLCQSNPAGCDHAFPFGINHLCRSIARHEYSM